ncbi:MAG TPA: ParB/RepB/Spo0J family partition protein [Deltaproteobacteria bacterium]|nr:ParB/RepB/Spo0J family partition protein [Deltaproteobacteria bacterium]
MEKSKRHTTEDLPPEPKAQGAALLEESRVEHIPMHRLDLSDDTYRFRAALRIGPLKRSIAAEGQQMPIVVRKICASRTQRYQIISGFRRSMAMLELDAETIAAIVRDDLDDDEAAFRASVLENSQRKTYSDIDRALVIKSYEARGYSSVEIAEVLGLTERQKRNLRGLLDLPGVVQEAIDDEQHRLTATHGLVLKQMSNKHPGLDFERWVTEVHQGNDGQGLSVAQLRRAINAAYRAKQSGSRPALLRADDTCAEEGVFRFNPVRVVVAELSDDDRDALKGELQAVLAALG